MKIGILSDTHNMLRPEVLEALQGCDLILHAGDIAKPEILDKLRQIAPTKVVRGNNDRAWAEDLPMQLAFELEGYRFFMTHKKRDIPGDVDADIVIFGHSHKYEEFRDGSILFLNPGSCGLCARPSCGVVEISNGKAVCRIVRLDETEEET